MENERTTIKKIKKSILYKIGIVLFILSSVLWVVPLFIPFTSLPINIKATIISISLVCAEGMFWISVLLVGKEVIKKYKNYLNPKNWRKKQNSDEEQNNQE